MIFVLFGRPLLAGIVSFVARWMVRMVSVSALVRLLFMPRLLISSVIYSAVWLCWVWSLAGYLVFNF